MASVGNWCKSRLWGRAALSYYLHKNMACKCKNMAKLLWIHLFCWVRVFLGFQVRSLLLELYNSPFYAKWFNGALADVLGFLDKYVGDSWNDCWTFYIIWVSKLEDYLQLYLVLTNFELIKFKAQHCTEVVFAMAQWKDYFLKGLIMFVLPHSLHGSSFLIY